MSPIFGKNDFKDGRAVLRGARRSPQKSHVMSLEVSLGGNLEISGWSFVLDIIPFGLGFMDTPYNFAQSVF